MNTVKSAYAPGGYFCSADHSGKQAPLLQMREALDELKKLTDAAETAKEYHDTVLPAMAALREPD